MTHTIQRLDSNDYLSEITTFKDVAYLAGQVPNTPTADITTQTKEVFANIDRLLAQVNSDKTRLLSAQIILKDLADFEIVNGLWAEWLKGCPKPTRATIEANLVNPLWRLEIIVTAAQKDEV